MKAFHVVKAACTAGLAAACVFGIAACSSSTSSEQSWTGGVAATVNGTEIAEDDVTAQIQNMRTSYGMEDDAAWGQALAEQGTTPEEMRQNVIDSYVDEELQKQGAEERGVTVEDSEIDGYVDSMKGNFGSDEEWQQALQGAGFEDENAYREQLRDALLLQKLYESFEGDGPTDEEVVAYAKENMTFDVAKRSSHILFEVDDQEAAQSVLDQINAGTLDFAEAAKQYSTDSSGESGGDVGWDALTTFVTEYQTALDGLSVGQVSGLVESEYGYHIIKCTEEFAPPAELTSVDQLPQDIADNYRESVKSEKANEAYQTWFDEYKAAADIVINDMPEGLPYAVDMSQYQTEGTTEEGADASADTSADAASAEGEGSAGDAASAETDAASAEDGGQSASADAASSDASSDEGSSDAS